MARFPEVFADVTKEGHKIAKEYYLPNGQYPIIDQGQDCIAGYWNEETGLYDDVPAIIFGDHTRIIKYVDIPCFLGADGVKLLKPVLKNTNCKYLYYALCSAKIPNTGYNRHFKWLKEVDIPIPSLAVQTHIAAVLDKVCDLISLRKQQLAKLDELVKARFVEMFGDPQNSACVLLEDISELVTVGIANSATHAYSETGTVMLRNQNIKENFLDECDLLYIDPKFANKYKTKALKENDILVIRTGYPGTACLVPKKYEGAQTFTTLIVRLKEKLLVSPVYVCQYINSEFGKAYVSNTKVGVAQQNFGAKVLAKMPIMLPHFELQEKYADFLKQIDNQKLTIQQSLGKLEVLKKTLMQEYFG